MAGLRPSHRQPRLGENPGCVTEAGGLPLQRPVAPPTRSAGICRMAVGNCRLSVQGSPYCRQRALVNRHASDQHRPAQWAEQGLLTRLGGTFRQAVIITFEHQQQHTWSGSCKEPGRRRVHSPFRRRCCPCESSRPSGGAPWRRPIHFETMSSVGPRAQTLARCW